MQEALHRGGDPVAGQRYARQSEGLAGHRRDAAADRPGAGRHRASPAGAAGGRASCRRTSRLRSPRMPKASTSATRRSTSISRAVTRRCLAASQVALTLRAVGGLTTAEIARAFLVPEATMAQRLSRAKQTIKAAGAGVPDARAARSAWRRLPAVLHVLYLIFSEGYAASSGDRVTRVELSAEAIRVARLLAQLLPEEPEVIWPARLDAAHRRAARARGLAPTASSFRSTSRIARPGTARPSREGERLLQQALVARRRRSLPDSGRHRRAARRGPGHGGDRLAADPGAVRRCSAG